MTRSKIFIIRLQNLFLWLGAGLAFWWMRPTPETQIELFGSEIPIVPVDWVMLPNEGALVQLYLWVFPCFAVLYFWIGVWDKHGLSLIWTYIHAVFVFITVNLITDPVRLDWVNYFPLLFADGNTSKEHLDSLRNAAGFVFCLVSAGMTLIAVKLKIASIRSNYLRSQPEGIRRAYSKMLREQGRHDPGHFH